MTSRKINGPLSVGRDENTQRGNVGVDGREGGQRHSRLDPDVEVGADPVEKSSKFIPLCPPTQRNKPDSV